MNTLSLEELHQAGQAAISRGDFAEASQQFRTALDRDPAFFIASLGMSMVERRQGRLAEAERVLQSALLLAPTNTWLLLELGQVYVEQFDYSKAHERFEQSRLADPRNVAAPLAIAELYRAQGMHSEYSEFVSRARDIDPTNEWVLRALANISLESSPVDLSVQPWCEIVSRNIFSNKDFTRAAEQLRELGRLDEARLLLAYANGVPASNHTPSGSSQVPEALPDSKFTLLAEDSAIRRDFGLEHATIMAADQQFDRALRILRHVICDTSVLSEALNSFEKLLRRIALSAPVESSVRDFVSECIPTVLEQSRTNESNLRICAALLLMDIEWTFVRHESEKFDEFSVQHALVINLLLAGGGVELSEAIFEHSHDLGFQVLIGSPPTPVVRGKLAFKALRNQLLANLANWPRIPVGAAVIMCQFRAFLSEPGFPRFGAILQESFAQMSYKQCLLATETNHFGGSTRDASEFDHCIENILKVRTLLPIHLVILSWLTKIAPPEQRQIREEAINSRMLSALDSTSPVDAPSEELASLRLIALYLRFQDKISTIIPPYEQLWHNDRPLLPAVAALQDDIDPLPKLFVHSPLCPDRPRIALCISGQLREYEAMVPHWKETILRDANIDVFIHTWNIVGRKMPHPTNFEHVLPKNFREALDRQVRVSSMAAVFSRYPSVHRYFQEGSQLPSHQALAALYETREDWVVIEDETLPLFAGWDNQDKMYYKVQACHHLMQRRGSSYDLVVRIRPDVLPLVTSEFSWSSLARALTAPRQIFTDIDYFIIRGAGIACGDMFAAGRPGEMERYASTYQDFRMVHEVKPYRWPKWFSQHSTFGTMLWMHGAELRPPPGLSFQLRSPAHMAPAAVLLPLVEADSIGRNNEDDQLLIKALRADIQSKA